MTYESRLFLAVSVKSPYNYDEVIIKSPNNYDLKDTMYVASINC